MQIEISCVYYNFIIINILINIIMEEKLNTFIDAKSNFEFDEHNLLDKYNNTVPLEFNSQTDYQKNY